MESIPALGEPSPQLPANTMTADGSSTNADNIPTPDEHPIAAPKSFEYLDRQLDKMDASVSDDQDGKPADSSTRPISVITKRRKR